MKWACSFLKSSTRKRSDAEQLHQIAGRNPVAFFMHIIVQKILGFLFGLALHDIAETPDLDVASVFFFGQAPILLDFRSGEIEIVVSNWMNAMSEYFAEKCRPCSEPPHS
jgi:hypothetical protein